MAVLGFASGLPLALTGQAMQAWLSAERVDIATIGFLSIVGLPYTFKGQMRMDEIPGCSPYGASTLADDGKGGHRDVSEHEMEGARFQGRHVAEIAAALSVGRLAKAS